MKKIIRNNAWPVYSAWPASKVSLCASLFFRLIFLCMWLKSYGKRGLASEVIDTVTVTLVKSNTFLSDPVMKCNAAPHSHDWLETTLPRNAQTRTLFLVTVYFNVTDLDRSLMYFFFLPKQYNEAVKHEANKRMWFCTAIVAHSHIISLLTSGHKKI